MNVNIIRDKDVSLELYQEVIELLQQSNGPLEFIGNESFSELDDVPISKISLDEKAFNIKRNYMFSRSANTNFPIERSIAKPKDILNKCKEFRSLNDIGNNEFVVLLTEQANSINWFSFLNSYNDAFIHTTDWGNFLGCNRSFPITYQIVSNVYHMILFKDMDDLNNHFHKESRGCINDLCQQKKDIKLKMRTADICEDCQQLMKARDFPLNIFNQMTAIMEDLRRKLLSVERFQSSMGPSRVEFRGHNRKMILLDAGEYEVKMTPLEKTVFHFFLDHPEGITANNIDSYFNELKEWYGIFYTGSNLADFNNRINSLCDYSENSMQEKISSIKRKFKVAVGETMAEYYIIQKDESDNKYKIKLNRDLVENNS